MRSGDVIAGKYLLEERLGSGGHAQVWRATWQVGGRDFGAVAIKFFHAEANVGELQLLTRLRHENLIALRGIEEHEGNLCGIMDFAEGGSAEALLRAYPEGVPVAQVGPILSQVCAALAYLHGESVVHRDVKPANIVFGGTRAMLCDVGISRAMERGRATHTGQGTMAYTPPELFQRGGVITAAVDVWALGVTAFELLTGGRHPFGETEAEIVAGALTRPPELPAGLDRGWEVLLRGCLAREPASRWSLSQAREALAGGRAEADPPRTPAPVAAPEPLRTPAPVAAPEPLRTPAQAGRWSLPRVWKALVGGSAAPERLQVVAPVAEPAISGGTPLGASAVVPLEPPRGYVWIPPGEFVMGSPADEKGRYADETPHRVRISRGYYMKATPLTQGEYEAVVGRNPSHFREGGSKCPVENVSWHDAVAYLNAMSDREGLPHAYDPSGRLVALDGPGYRLPTEAEWEYAARAGTTGAHYGALNDIAWYEGNSRGRTHPVGKKRPNAWGLYDMLGNVWEWTGDWYGEYARGDQTDPVGPASGVDRVDRGGSWRRNDRDVRTAYRDGYSPDFRSDYLGFRPVKSHPPGVPRP